MNNLYLIQIGCIVSGIILTRFSTSVPTFLGLIFNIASIGLFLFPVIHELYEQYTTEQEHFNRKILWQLPLTCVCFFFLLISIAWLQGKTELLKNGYDVLGTLNMAVILTSSFYAYQVHIRPWITSLIQKNK